MSVSRIIQQAAAGNAGEAIYVDDVFSTYLYDGNATARSIVNGIDLDGEGGLVWTKERSDAANHHLYDTERGALKRIFSNTTDAEQSIANSLTSFNSDGFSLGTGGTSNANGEEYASWAFRKQPGFFDVVTYTGDGTSGRQIAHNLGSTPGMMIVKATSDASGWAVYHRSLGATKAMLLNTTDTPYTFSSYWNDTEPTDSVFTLGSGWNVNGIEFVAYLFAHDAQDFGTDSDESIIKCGSYTGNGSTDGPEIDLGFEPQWVMIKRSNGTSNWWIADNIRGFVVGGNDARLYTNLSNDESNTFDYIDPLPNGFKLTTDVSGYNGSGDEVIYVAIRRPHKPASEFAATDLFAMDVASGEPRYTAGFPVDSAMQKNYVGGGEHHLASRITGDGFLATNTTGQESTSSAFVWDYQNGWGSNFTSSNVISYMWRRSPGFFDVVAYTGNGTGQNIPHSLGVAPEMMWIKRRNYDYRWTVYYPEATNRGTLELNSTAARTLNSSTWNDTAPTATHFTVGTDFSVNHTHPYIAYLFASVAGISKVGSYTGTGSDVDVDCGFSAGARFVLAKRTDSTGDWYLWDSERGIVAGNDPYLLVNSSAAQVTSTDYIDPLSSGFTITSTAPAALNTSGGTYLFLAIA